LYKPNLVAKHLSSYEEVIADEEFLAWYAGDANQKAVGWNHWLAQHPECQPLVDEAVSYLNSIKLTESPVSAAQLEHAHHRLMQTLDSSTKVIPMRSRGFKWWMSAAAVVLILVTGAIFWNSNKESQLKLNTPFGQIANHKLPDGSEVLLNANSKLSMKESWKGKEDREVWLEGEAFFHVKKTSTKNRFIVHSSGVDIIVTGTQFNVVNRNGESNVLLKEGSVTLKTKEGQLIKMLPGDFVTFSNNLPQKEVTPEEKVLAWTQAKLFFENTPLVDAAKTISQHYGVKVKVNKDIEKESIDGILSNENLDVLLKTLVEAKGFTIMKTNNEIIISRPKL
jgi:transmembrane sensor